MAKLSAKFFQNAGTIDGAGGRPIAEYVFSGGVSLDAWIDQQFKAHGWGCAICYVDDTASSSRSRPAPIVNSEAALSIGHCADCGWLIDCRNTLCERCYQLKLLRSSGLTFRTSELAHDCGRRFENETEAYHVIADPRRDELAPVRFRLFLHARPAEVSR